MRFVFGDKGKNWVCLKCNPGDPMAEDGELDRVARNCDGDTNPAFPLRPYFDLCPNIAITERSKALLSMWLDYTTLNILPYPGELGDNPAYVSEAISLCNLIKEKIVAELSNGR